LHADAAIKARTRFRNLRPDHRLLPQGSKETRKTADASAERFSPNISEKFFRIGMLVKETEMNF
jgi:hypothetical protein